MRALLSLLAVVIIASCTSETPVSSLQTSSEEDKTPVVIDSITVMEKKKEDLISIIDIDSSEKIEKDTTARNVDSSAIKKDNGFITKYDPIYGGGYPDGIYTLGQMRRLPGGIFVHGDDYSIASKPAHTVSLSPFFIDTTEVTNADYKKYFPARFNEIVEEMEDFNAADNAPICYLTRPMMIMYFNARSKAEGLDTVYTYDGLWLRSDEYAPPYAAPKLKNFVVKLFGLKADYTKNGYRFPTNAEWEFAARGGVADQTYWGKNYTSAEIKYIYTTVEDTLEINKYAVWYGENGFANKERVSEVATRIPNGYGLYDVFGNVGEFVEDARAYFQPISSTNQVSVNFEYYTICSQNEITYDPMGFDVASANLADSIDIIYGVRGGNLYSRAQYIFSVAEKTGSVGHTVSQLNGLRAVRPDR